MKSRAFPANNFNFTEILQETNQQIIRNELSFTEHRRFNFLKIYRQFG